VIFALNTYNKLSNNVKFVTELNESKQNLQLFHAEHCVELGVGVLFV